MPIISFAFNKIIVEKKKAIEAPLKVKTSIKIIDLKEEELKKDLLLKFSFEYRVDYETEQANLILGGDLLFAGPRNELEKIFKEWKKTKKFSPEISKDVLNNIFIRCNVKALFFEQEANLPPHIVLPRLQPMAVKKGKSEDYIG
ncbi:hypothetical protein J4223_01130 [Candidatus Woesearchaeota archaeon]|nr:hypothetical protein [Candidatus Woesearchaeota archaeon]